MCFPAHGAGMVKGALIECTETGVFLNNGTIVCLSPQRMSRNSEFCVHRTDAYSEDLPPLLLSVSAFPLQTRGSLFWFFSPVGLACSGMPSQRKNVLE